MKKRLLLLAIPLLLSGCSTSSLSNGGWSKLSPLNWFSSQIELTDSGLQGVNEATALSQEALNAALDNRYSLRYGLSMSNGQMLAFYQGLDKRREHKEKGVLVTFFGHSKGNVERIEVLDQEVSSWGVHIGTLFSDIYVRAFEVCQRGKGVDADYVICQAPQSERVSYLFSGEWSGPESLIPADSVLKTWRVNKIIWQATAEQIDLPPVTLPLVLSDEFKLVQPPPPMATSAVNK